MVPGYFADAEEALEAQSDRSAAVLRHTHSLGEVMTGRRSMGEKKNNELMMTHRRHVPCLALAHACTQSHTFLMGSRISTGVEFTKSALERPIYSAQPPHPTTQFLFHFPASPPTLYPQTHKSYAQE